MSEPLTTETEATRDLYASQNPIHDVGDGQVAIIPGSYNLHNLEKFLPKPTLARGTLQTEDLVSFAAAFKRWAEPTGIILASPNAKHLVAHFRHHSNQSEDAVETARWIDHKAILALTDAEEWKAWQSVHEKPLSQKQFFQFLEDRIEDVTSPEPAELLEIAETIRGTRRVNFQNAQRMSNGDISIIWDEVTEAKAGEKGQGTVPSKITIRVPIYEQAPYLLFDVTCSFRWRVENTGLQISISIRHLATVQRLALAALLDKMKGLIGEPKPVVLIGNWMD